MSRVQFTDVYPDDPTAPAPAGPGTPAPSSNPTFPGMPVGASPIHRDFVSSSAGTYTIWDPGAGNKFVLASAILSTAAGGRVALVDAADVAGQRIIDLELGANGGATPNLVPVPYVSGLAGRKLTLVTDVAGDVRVKVSGWLGAA